MQVEVANIIEPPACIENANIIIGRDFASPKIEFGYHLIFLKLSLYINFIEQSMTTTITNIMADINATALGIATLLKLLIKVGGAQIIINNN